MKIKRIISSILAASLLATSLAFSLTASAGAEFSIDFTKMEDSSTLPDGWDSVGSAEIKDGALQLHSPSSGAADAAIALIPKFANKSDFTMVVEFSIENEVNNSRWASLMFRGSNNKDKNFAPYMQMCIRKDATASNGVELSTRTVSNTWTVHAAASAKSTTTTHTAKVIAKGKRIAEILDDELVINYSNANLTGYYYGLQANGCTMKVTKINIYDAEEIPEKQIPMQKVYEPQTSLVTPPLVFTNVNDGNYSILSNERPPQAALTAFSNGKIDGGKTLDEFIKACSDKVIPIIDLQSATKEDLTIVTDYITANNINDIMIMSDSIDTIKSVRAITPQVKGVYLSAGLTDIKEIAKNAHQAGANIVELFNADGTSFTEEDYEYLQMRSLTVWTDASDYQSAILNGVNGIFSYNDGTEIYDFLEKFTETTLVKDPFVIGHRGLPTVAPENTIESFKEAIKAGADIVENDAYLTTDGEIVINHNGTVDGYTTGGETGSIESYSLSQLKAMTLKDVGTYSGCKFATMDEFFEVLKENPDLFLFIEIKSSKPELVTKLKALIDEYQVIDQVGVISFIDSQLLKVRELIPQISVGNLKSGATSGAVSALDGVYMMNKVISPSGSSFNPDYYSITADMTRLANYRGISIWPWTLNAETQMLQFIGYGVTGVTTDYANWSADIASSVELPTETINIKTGDVIDIKSNVLNYKGDVFKENVSVNLKLIDSEGIELRSTADGLIASKAGTGKAVLEYKYAYSTGKNYYNVVSKIVDITVTGDDIPEVVIKPGDVDNNGIVNSLDALSILKHIADLDILEGNALAAADYDQNGVVNTLDSLGILKFMIGLE